MAGWKDFAFEWRERSTAYPIATTSHIAIYGDDTHTLYTIDASGVDANHHMGHLEVVDGSTSWRGDVTNEAWGEGVLVNTTTGKFNTGIGGNALASNIQGNNNTACGYMTLSSNTSGSNNTASGYMTLSSNTSGSNNTAFGHRSLSNNTTGNNNTAIGTGSLAQNISGSGNVAIGFNAGYYENGSNKLFITNTAGTSADALIYGEFDTKRLYVNGSVNIMQTLMISGNAPLTLVSVPPTSSSFGVPGTVAYNSTHMFICIANNSWKRITLDTF
jgi:hypothetical protein